MAANTTSKQGRIRLPLHDERLNSLIFWDDPKKSGLVLGGVTVAYLFLQFGKYNAISLIASILSAVVFASLLWSIAGGILKKPPPPLPRIITEGIPEAQLRAYADKATPVLNKGLNFLNRTLNGTEPITTAVVGIALYAAGQVASAVSLLTLAYIPVLFAFILPKVYELKKDEIDSALNTARARFTAFYDKYLAAIMARIPRAQTRGASPAESSSMRKME